MVSPIHAVAKKGADKFRLICDLRYVNSHVHVDKFSNEDIRSVFNIVEPDDYIITVDLKQGFFHVPVNVNDQDLLGFKFGKRYLKWKCLPFGFKGSPYYFNKVLRPVLRYLRSKGLRVSLYVDDFILCASKDDIEIHKKILLDTLISLGLTINYDKSSLNPSQKVEYLGYIIRTDSEYPILEIPEGRVKKLKKDIAKTLAGECVSARSLARILGQCVSMTKAVLPGKLLLRNAYRLLSSKQFWSDKLFLDIHTRKDLNWWLESLDNWNGSPIRKQPIDIQLVTDSSGYAWGAHLEKEEAFGLWDNQVSNKSSNYREMMAVLMGLHSFSEHIRNKHVQVLSDNISTVAYLNKLGGSSKELSDLATTICVLVEELNIKITVAHIRGVLNVRADGLSRIVSRHEWELHQRTFMYIDSIWGPHSCDRFATFLNHKVEMYNSWGFDPGTSGINALAQSNWKNHNNFVNAPFGLINKVIDVIQKQEAMATVIAPWWPAQTWFHRLRKLSICPPIPLGKTGDIVINHSEIMAEPLKNPAWKLFAWRICGYKD